MVKGRCKLTVDLEFKVKDKFDDGVMTKAVDQALTGGLQFRDLEVTTCRVNSVGVIWDPPAPPSWKMVFNSDVSASMWGTISKAAEACLAAGYHFMAFNGRIFSVSKELNVYSEYQATARDTGATTENLK